MKLRLLTSLLICMVFSSIGILHAQTLVGYWTVYTDDSERPRAVVQITRRNGLYNGRIVRVYSKHHDRDFCVRCPQPFTNKPLLGLRLLWDLQQSSEGYYSGGRILDPRKGRIYRCKITFDNNGASLRLRAYIGISLMGQTQTWVRRARLNKHED